MITFSDVARCRNQEDCSRVWREILTSLHGMSNKELLAAYEEGRVFWNPYCVLYARQMCPLNKSCGPHMRLCVVEWYDFDDALKVFVLTGTGRYELDIAIIKLRGVL